MIAVPADRSTRMLSAAVLALLSLIPLFLVWLAGSGNPFTPAGYVGYLTKGALFGQTRFYGTQRGPDVAGPRLDDRCHQCQRDALHVHRELREGRRGVESRQPED